MAQGQLAKTTEEACWLFKLSTTWMVTVLDALEIGQTTI